MDRVGYYQASVRAASYNTTPGHVTGCLATDSYFTSANEAVITLKPVLL